MSNIVNLPMNRRRFLEAGVAGGSLVLGFTLPGCSSDEQQTNSSAALPASGLPTGDGTLNAFISIAANGNVTLQLPFVEMGQGTYTSLPMLIAEEMDIGLESVNVVQAPHGPEYRIMFGNTLRFTGGSYSVRASFEPLRRAGATARQMLMQAAAKQWQTDTEELSTEPFYVVHKSSNRRASYAELAGIASTLTPPQTVKLKEPAEFRLIGTPSRRTDTQEKSTGKAWFGTDTKVDGMLFAAIKQAPVFGTEVKHYDATRAMTMPGVSAVETIPRGIAVIADNHWRAEKALQALVVEFTESNDSIQSSEDYLQKLNSRLDDKGLPAESVGNISAAFSSAEKIIEAQYHTPLLAHATMEPMNCTALVKNGKCSVWAPNQGVDSVAARAAKITGLSLDKIEVHTPYLGGGFGRRSFPDYAEQAITLAQKMQGQAIKVIWSREEDTRHDVYRPMTAAKYRAAINEDGQVTGLHVSTVGDGPGRSLNPQTVSKTGIDRSVVEGIEGQDYQFPNLRIDYIYESSPFPIGYWRSVGNSHNAFFKESFVDEMAVAVNKDPLTFRKELLKGQSRYLYILDKLAEMTNWDGQLVRELNGQKRALGLALHKAYGTIIGEIAEVSLDNTGRALVHQVYCAVDCGIAVNPRIITMQIESAIAYGLSAALDETITVESGQTTNSNFHDYPILNAQQMPNISVVIVDSKEALGGIGEAGTPPIAPAVCNALYALTGKRLRSLPINRTLKKLA